MHLLKSHATALDYARFKNIYPQQVYSAITNGLIKPDAVGISGMQMINMKKYGDLQFPKRKRKNGLLKQWHKKLKPNGKTFK